MNDSRMHIHYEKKSPATQILKCLIQRMGILQLLEEKVRMGWGEGGLLVFGGVFF